MNLSDIYSGLKKDKSRKRAQIGNNRLFQQPNLTQLLPVLNTSDFISVKANTDKKHLIKVDSMHTHSPM